MSDWQTEAAEREAKIQAVMAELGIIVSAEFVPWSRSRNYQADKAKDPNAWSLNWKVSLTVKGRPILTTDYSAGIGHAPSYNNWNTKEHGGKLSIHHADNYLWPEVEQGRRIVSPLHRGPAILPDPCDVLYSLVRDSDVIAYDTFEDWASCLGYEEDSRKAEAIYRACLETALKLRNGIGEVGLARLREVFQDY